jgi:hypothetical protein
MIPLNDASQKFEAHKTRPVHRTGFLIKQLFIPKSIFLNFILEAAFKYEKSSALSLKQNYDFNIFGSKTRIAAAILVSSGSLFPISCHLNRHSDSYINLAFAQWLNVPSSQS